MRIARSVTFLVAAGNHTYAESVARCAVTAESVRVHLFGRFSSDQTLPFWVPDRDTRMAIA